MTGRATITVSTLERWNAAGLDGAGNVIRGDRDRVRDQGDAVYNAATSAITRSAWHGQAADGARRDARRRHDRVDALAEALQIISRAVLTAADNMERAKALLEDARALTARHGLILTDDGRVPPPPPMLSATNLTDAQWERLRSEIEARASAATQAQHMAQQALATAAVSVWWEHLNAAERARLLAAYPELLGNLDGIPYPTRIAANQVLIGRAAEQLRADLDVARLRLEELERGFSAGTLPISSRDAADHEITQLRSTITAGEERLAFYTSLTTDRVPGYHPDHGVTTVTGRQVVLFDPENGRFAEVVGPLHPGTRHVGLLVGGTGTNMLTMDAQRERAEEFVKAEDEFRDLAVVTYLGGPMPQNIFTEAPRSSYALELAPGLRDFAAGVDRPAGATLTAVGHSYGGSVVGAAEAAGMQVDRVLHVASAGAGPGVHSPEDYAAPDTPRYSITAPGDFIEATQGGTLGSGIGHGADPDDLDGVVRLESGLVDRANHARGVLAGGAAHSGVFGRESTAWQNIYEVMVGGTVSVYTVDFAMGDHLFVPPTREVR